MDTNQQDDLRIALDAIDGLFEEGDCTCRYCLARAVVLALHGDHSDGQACDRRTPQ